MLAAARQRLVGAALAAAPPLMKQTRPDGKCREERATYPEVPPAPDLGAPVSPSPIRGATAEKDRWSRARLAVMVGRTIA